MKFPTTSGSDKHGRRVTLPTDLDGEQTLVVVSFHLRQRSLVSSWREFADELREEFEHFEYHELVVGREGGMLPPMSKGGMSPANASHRLHENTVFLSVNKQAFQRQLGILGDQTIHTFLLEDDYVVRRAAGVLTPETAGGLESLLREYRDVQNRTSTGVGSAGESPS
ncbi:MAG: hypothetical protein ABEI27_05320 [Halobellus sp.]|uniref:hypothetical protein n=1 Tax=Halobellus sp. TaxID=1979212 RepID=UPI0035D51C4C